MSKRAKQIVVLLVVLVVCVAAYFAVTAIGKANEKKAAEEEAAAIIHVGDIDSVVELKMVTDEDELIFKFDGTTWQYDGESDFTLDTGVVENIAEEVADLVSDYKIEAEEDLSEYGVDAPTYTVYAKDVNGKEMMLSIGKAYGRLRHYAMVDGEAELYTVSNDFVSMISADLAAYVVPETPPQITEDQVVSITAVKGTTEFEVIRKAAESTDESGNTANWYVVSNGQEINMYDYTTAALPTSGDAAGYITAFISSIVKIGFADCSVFEPTQAELSEVGLTGSNVITVSVEYIVGTDDDGNNETAIYTVSYGNGYSYTNDNGETITMCYATTDETKYINTISSTYAEAALAVIELCAK